MEVRYKEILNKLEEEYPDAKCELNHETPFQLLVATVLSAQTTDKKVNQVTERLFKENPTIKEFLKLSQEEIIEYIRQLGLYRNKAKNIYIMCRQLKENFNSKVPSNLKDLTSLAGVGRKTANVVMSNAFNIPAIAVDTHVFRVSNRIGLAKANDVNTTEKHLMKNIDRDMWTKAHHLLIFHGRRCCIARNPKCSLCTIKDNCKYYKDITDNK